MGRRHANRGNLLDSGRALSLCVLVGVLYGVLYGAVARLYHWRIARWRWRWLLGRRSGCWHSNGQQLLEEGGAFRLLWRFRLPHGDSTLRFLHQYRLAGRLAADDRWHRCCVRRSRRAAPARVTPPSRSARFGQGLTPTRLLSQQPENHAVSPCAYNYTDTAEKLPPVHQESPNVVASQENKRVSQRR